VHSSRYFFFPINNKSNVDMASPIFASSPGILVTAQDYADAAPLGPVVLLPISYISTIGNQIIVRDGAGQASAVTPITVSTVGGVGYTRDISSTVISSIRITRAGDSVAVAPVTPYLYKVLDSREFPNTSGAPLSIKPSYELISTISTGTLDALSTLQLQGSLEPLVAFQFTNPATSYAEFTSTVTNTGVANTFYSGTTAGSYNYHSTGALSTMSVNSSDVVIGGAHQTQNMTVVGHMDVCGSVAVGAHYSTVEGGIIGSVIPFSAGSHVSVADGFSTVSNFYSGGSIDVSGGFTIGGHVSTGQVAVAGLATHKSTVYVSSALTVGTLLAADSAAYTSSIAVGKTTGPTVALDISGGLFGLGAFIDARTYSTTLISTGGFTASTVNLNNGTAGVFRSLYTSNNPSKLYYDGVEVVGGAVSLDSKVQQMTVSSFVSAAVLFVSSAFFGGSNYASPFQMEVNGGMNVVDGKTNRLYVAGGSNNTTTGIGTLKWSADGGLTWNNNVTGGFSNSVSGGAGQGVGWNGRLWVAVGHSDLGQKSTIQTSTDGSNWTAAASGGFGTSNGGNTLTDGHGVAWNGQQWVAAGSYGDDTTPLGSLLYSGDGSNWSNAASGGFSGSGANGATGYDVAWNGRQWVAVGRSDISRNYPIDSMSPSARNSLVGLYSLKKLRSAYTGPLISVRRSQDNSNNDFYGDLNGNLSNLSGTSITSWLSATSPASTGLISKWWDQSTRGNHATQNTDVSQALYNSAGYITFGTGKYLSLPDGTVPGSNSKYTMAYRHNTIDGGTAGTNRMILASGYNSNNQGIFLAFIGGNPITTNAFYRDDWRANSTQGSNYAIGNTFATVYNQTNATSYLNGIMFPEGPIPKSNQTNPSINNYIGYAPVFGTVGTISNLSLAGDLYYLAIYNDALGTADRNLAETNGPVTASNATIQYSTDGSNWALSSPTAPGCSLLTRGLAWNGAYWVAVGRDATAANNIKYSFDGYSWLASAAGAFNTEGSSVCWNGQAWFATGRDTTSSNNTIKYSFDGRNWSNITSGGFSNTAATGGIHITYDGTKLLAGGFGTTATSNMKYSYNGLNWSDASGSFATAGFAVSYGTDMNPRLRIDGLDFYNDEPNPFIRSTNTIFTQTPQLTTSLTHSTNMVLNNTVYINSPNGIGINIDGISSAAVAVYVYGSTYTNNPNPVKLTGGSWTSVSDSNWKDTLPTPSDEILLNAVNYISSLKPKEFNYNKSLVQPYINTKGIEMRNMVIATKNLANNRSALNAQEELAVTTLKKIKGNNELTSYSGQLKEITEESHMMREVGFLSYDIGSTIKEAIEPINIDGTMYEGVNYDQINMIHLATTHHLMSTIECQTSTLQGQEEEISRIFMNFETLGSIIGGLG